MPRNCAARDLPAVAGKLSRASAWRDEPLLLMLLLKPICCRSAAVRCVVCTQHSITCAQLASSRWLTVLPTQPCPPLLQALRASPLRRLRRLGRVLVFSLPCELLWRLGLSPYTVYVRFLLVMTWLVAWIYFLLLATQIISPVSEFAYMITTGFFIALMLLLKDELEMRQADIVKLAAMPAKAHRMANQLPEELDSLRPVVDSFGASAQPAVALTQQALAVVQRTFDRLDRLVRPWG